MIAPNSAKDSICKKAEAVLRIQPSLTKYKAEQLNELYDVLKYNDLMDLPTGLYLVKGATLLTLSQI